MNIKIGLDYYKAYLFFYLAKLGYLGQRTRFASF